MYKHKMNRERKSAHVFERKYAKNKHQKLREIKISVRTKLRSNEQQQQQREKKMAKYMLRRFEINKIFQFSEITGVHGNF